MKAANNASRRTKNRLQEHKSLKIVENRKHVLALEGNPGTLLKCEDCNWIGWIPTIELIEE